MLKTKQQKRLPQFVGVFFYWPIVKAREFCYDKPVDEGECHAEKNPAGRMRLPCGALVWARARLLLALAENARRKEKTRR